MARLVPAYLAAAGLAGICVRLLVVFSSVHIIRTNTFQMVLGDAMPSMVALLFLTLFCIVVWYLVDRSVLHIAQYRLARLQTVLTAHLPALDEADLLRILLDDQRHVATALSNICLLYTS